MLLQWAIPGWKGWMTWRSGHQSKGSRMCPRCTRELRGTTRMLSAFNLCTVHVVYYYYTAKQMGVWTFFSSIQNPKVFEPWMGFFSHWKGHFWRTNLKRDYLHSIKDVHNHVSADCMSSWRRWSIRKPSGADRKPLQKTDWRPRSSTRWNAWRISEEISF